MAYWTGGLHGYTWAEEDEVPVGTIAMWSSLNGAIPTGWAECNGTDNAPGPDLRDRFIVGANAKPVDTSGGAATHVHADNLAHDAHGVTQPASHVFTQPSGHSAHAALATHQHELPFQLINGSTSRQRLQASTDSSYCQGLC